MKPLQKPYEKQNTMNTQIASREHPRLRLLGILIVSHSIVWPGVLELSLPACSNCPYFAFGLTVIGFGSEALEPERHDMLENDQEVPITTGFLLRELV